MYVRNGCIVRIHAYTYETDMYMYEGRAAERRIDVRNGCIGRIYAYRYIKRIYTCMKEGLLKEA